jgi:o-succinylbenzoate---CoA ligase
MGMQVEAWLERAAAAAPSATAIESAEGELSYAELHACAQAGARALLQRGVQRGQQIAIALPPGLAFAQALHSCMLLGAVAVPLDLRLTRAERGRIAQGASAIVDEPLSTIHPPTGDRPALIPTGDRPALTGSRHELGSVAVVIHTSGTTSLPKPVELTYGNLLWSALGSAVALGLDPQERWLCVLPLTHVGGLSILVRSAIYATTAVVHERFDTERVLDALMTGRVTLVSLVSTTLSRLLDAGLREPPDLRCALTGGGPVPTELVRRARAVGVPVCQTYGLTECCSQAATATPDGASGAVAAGGVAAGGVAVGGAAVGGAAVGRAASQGAASGEAGAPLFCTTVEIAEDGEILLSGPTVAPSALASDGRLHTGDLGWLDEWGFLHVTGRKADTIVTGGENVSPTEVEAVIEAHPAVIEAAVVGREDPQWGEAVNAIVVVTPASDVGEEQLRAHCSAMLAPFKVPKRFTLISEPLPRTRSGKLLRRELR